MLLLFPLVLKPIDKEIKVSYVEEIHTKITYRQIKRTPIFEIIHSYGMLDRTLNKVGQTYYKKNEKRLAPKIGALAMLWGEEMVSSAREDWEIILSQIGWKPLTEISLKLLH